MEDIKELLYKIRRFIDEDEILKKEKRKRGEDFNVFNPSLTPIVVESRCYFTFEVLAMNSVSYKFLFF